MEIDPRIMRQQLEESSGRYKTRENIESAFTPEEFELVKTYPDGESELPRSYEPSEQEGFRMYNNPKDTEEQEVPGLPGVYPSNIDAWKQQYLSVFLYEIQGEPFLVRPLERAEYKEILMMPGTDPLIREEIMCEYCVLYPQGYDFSVMAHRKAGLPAMLSEFIMEISAFTKDVVIREL